MHADETLCSRQKQAQPTPRIVIAHKPKTEIGRRRLALRIERVAREAGVGPFPDISGNIEEAVLIRAETADGSQRLVHRVLCVPKTLFELMP
jgi:hypothetical protein